MHELAWGRKRGTGGGEEEQKWGLEGVRGAANQVEEIVWPI